MELGRMSRYQNGFKNGVAIRGVPLMMTHPGNVFWVCNAAAAPVGVASGSDGNDGAWHRPFATIAKALTRCTAGQGDLILVKPGHAETISSAAILALNVAGVAIIGIGQGSNRPTLTFTAAAANIPVTAKDMAILNFLFVANFADVASFFTATGTATPTDFTIQGNEFRDTSAILNALTVFTGNATANSCDGFAFIGNRVSSLGTTAATTALKLLSDTKRPQIADNFGCSAVLNDTAALLAASTFQLTDFDLARNKWARPNTSSTGGSFVSGSGNAWTGQATDNEFWQVDNTAGIWISTGHGVGFGYHNNKSPITGAVDKSGLANPAEV